MKQHIYLIGFMGTGKTTISHKLRELTGAKEIDMDAWIVEKNALSINEMFEKYGETYFETGRRMLYARLQSLLRQSYPAAAVRYCGRKIHR